MKKQEKRARPASLPPPIYVDTPLKLRAAVALLGRETLLALDTESNSLHAYQERVCLIQVSTRQHDYIIDPLPMSAEDMQPFGALLADPAVEKVFHAAEYDLFCLRRDYGFSVRSLFDTALAARVCGIKETGLGSLVRNFFGISMDKSHQRDDWGERPLPQESLNYAQMDTHYLPDLRDALTALLAEQGRTEEAHEWFAETCDLPPPKPRPSERDSFWRLALPNQLTPEQCAALRAIYILREQLARKRDLPPFKILSDQVLVNIARAMPTHPRELRRVAGMSGQQAERLGDALIDAIRTALAEPPPVPPPLDPPADPLVVERYTALREWRKQRAAQRGVEADVIISKEALWLLAERDPITLDGIGQVRGFGAWRRAAYGDELLAVLHRFRSKT